MKRKFILIGHHSLSENATPCREHLILRLALLRIEVRACQSLPRSIGHYYSSRLAKHKMKYTLQGVQLRILGLSKNKADNRIYFSEHDNGIMKNCVYSPKACADDCSQGVSISRINFE